MSADWPGGIGRLILDQTDSTNAAALRHSDGPAWIMAHRQTAARGRRGRPWAMPAGNFAASLVFRPEMPADRCALYSFVAAMALHDVLAEATTRSLALKWPNDVLLDGGKVAGILLESSSAGGGIDRLVVGFGVNLVTAPQTVEPEAIRPLALDWNRGPEAFLDRLAPAFAAREATFRAEGFAPIRAAWLSRAARLGQQVTARTGTATRTGRFEDVDATGALVLGTEAGTSAIAAADVFF